ncbi:HSP90-domain-containing protein [Marasmius fiardii PR-910]|nr:HSP90-domain-containing protein [Marasmius fiardii PR-910]
MSIPPPFIPPNVPPLPPPWTQHLSPTGQPYYHNPTTKESTYIRPLPTFLQTGKPVSEPQKKKDKPLSKIQIPGTEWLRVRTTEGRIFYMHKTKKESVWTVPEEIKNALAQFEKEENEKREQVTGTQGKPTQNENDEEMKEVERIVKRKAEAKKARIETTQDQEEDSDNEEEEEEEEEWHREAAAQLAVVAEEVKRAEEETKHQQEETRKMEREEQAQKAKELREYASQYSPEEARAIFKTLLREKDINPLHPWDTSLPRFVNDRRYSVLSSVTARKEAFDEYCRERARELRQANVKKDKGSTPQEEFEGLLEAEVKSTRTSWTDFRRAWKKDRRFYGWGRDDREREKRFREFIKELGQKKKIAAEKAEADFINLLKEKAVIPEGAIWKEVKKDLISDSRYDAVGSSTLREELFNTFVKAKSGLSKTTTDRTETSGSIDQNGVKEDKAERKRRALQEREAKVRAEREHLEVSIGRSKMDLNKEEGERDFTSLLTDAVRDPQTSWDDILPQLQTDPRFSRSPLPLNQQLHLFHSHVAHLRSKHMDNLRALFESLAPSLVTEFRDLSLETLLNSLPVVKLELDIDALNREFDRWQRERKQKARLAFDDMMKENSFVSFWGKLNKIGGEGVDGGVKRDEDGDGDEGEGGGGKVDMKVLAKNIDVGEIEKVLKNDKRYVVFEHIPEERESWIRHYLSTLSAPDLSVHVPARYVLGTSNKRTTKMRVSWSGTFIFSLLLGYSVAQKSAESAHPKFDYQSDVARMRKIVINRDIFLRELVSNANDANEKLRLTALKDKRAWNGIDPLNITIKAVKDEEGTGGRIIISDTGIGMSPEELRANLGTLAKSGTSEFLAQADGAESSGNKGNLIGAFGLGFYSSFLVADRVFVASIPPKSEKNPNPVQHIFYSSADENSFEVYPDPRGNTLGRGTEITLHLKPETVEYLDNSVITTLVEKHSSYSTAFPIYLFNQKMIEVPDEEAEAEAKKAKELKKKEEKEKKEATESESEKDEDEAVVEEEVEEEGEEEPQKMKSVVVDEWLHLNSQPAIWMRDPKDVTDEDYKLFYSSFFKDSEEPMEWQHFSAETSGVSFKAIIYLPNRIDDTYWQQPLQYQAKDVKIMNKGVFITSELGEDGQLPKWASWVKVVVDADDLPLMVSRETLQSSRFLKQLKGVLLKRVMGMFTKLTEEEDKEKFEAFHQVYKTVIKLGAVEDTKNREKLSSLTRFYTNVRNMTSLDQYLENRKQGQKQIFFLSEMGKDHEELSESVFVEKLHARGYEVLLLNEPLDEIFVQNIRNWKNVPFQDVAKVGLKFGDEALAEKDEKEQQKMFEKKFKPLLDYLRKKAFMVVRDVVISNRLVTSPVAVVADHHGYTANVQRMMSASNAKAGKGYLHEFAMKAKLLEINPRSPLIEGLLKRVESLPKQEDEEFESESESIRDLEAEEELDEVISILIDGALVRSGFEVPNTNRFFHRVDRVLRRSLGVSETAEAPADVKPAPPVDPNLPTEEEMQEFEMPEDDDGKAKVIVPPHLRDEMSIEMEEIDEEGNPVVQHDEL